MQVWWKQLLHVFMTKSAVNMENEPISWPTIYHISIKKTFYHVS